MTGDELKDFLISKATQFENPEFIENDPIIIPHRYRRKEDIEIIALLIATIAWGNRKSIIKSGNALSNIFGESPYDFIMHFKHDRYYTFVHRTFSGIDLVFFCAALQRIYIEEGGLEAVFKKEKNDTIATSISNFRKAMLIQQHEPRSRKHISDPLSNSACKRLNMYLRWMVRPATKGVDFGLWKKIQPSELHIPLDVHTGNIARKLGILSRNQNDWKTSSLLYNYAHSIYPEDPSALDFALFGLGAIEKF